MPSIRKRSDRPRPWQARYATADGSQRSRSFHTKADAKRWLTAEVARQDTGAWVDPRGGRTSFAAWVARWRDGLHDLRPTTKALNLGIVDGVLLPRFGPAPLVSIRTADVRVMVAEDLAAARLSASAVRRRVIVLRSIMRAAVAEGLIGVDPCEGVRLPPESRRDMRFLEPDQVRALAEATPAHYRPLIYTAAYVGLRYGELAGLAVGAVDTLRRRITVERTLVDVHGKLSFGPPKSRAGRRTVTMPAGIADMVGAHMDSAAVRSSGLVFPTVSGVAMRRQNWRTTWTAAVVEAFGGTDLDGLVFHELRHTAAALAIAVGAHPLVIRDRLGHASITTTLDVYGGLFPSQDEALAEALDRTLADSLVAHTRPKDDRVARLRRSEGV